MFENLIKNSTTFNNLKLKLMETDKKYYAVKNSKEITGKRVQKATIGKNNTLTLSAKILENNLFKAGDSFHIMFSKTKITLTSVKQDVIYV